MDAFKHMMEAMPDGSTRRAYGTAHWDGSQWWANINGNLIGARWMDPIQPLQGGQIVVDISREGRGLYSALVLGGYTDQPRPSTGVILAFGVLEIVISGEDGVTYTTKRYLGPLSDYTIADNVYITWDAATPTILGLVNEMTITPPANTPLPPGGGDITGTQKTPATASDTWWGPGGWGSYATSRFGGEDIYSGSYYSGATTGAWFYGPANTVLAGKTIKQARFRIPARLNAGSYNSDATVHLYAHTSQSRPGGDVTRTVGPFDVTVPARYTPAGHTFTAGLSPGWVVLPDSFHAVLIAGGGISISGDPYVGFQSRLKDPESGKLEMDWSN